MHVVWDLNSRDYLITEAINVLDLSSHHVASGTAFDICFPIVVFISLLFIHTLFANRYCCQEREVCTGPDQRLAGTITNPSA